MEGLQILRFYMQQNKSSKQQGRVQAIYPILDQMVKIYSLFQVETAQSHTLWHHTYLYNLYEGVPLKILQLLTVNLIEVWFDLTLLKIKFMTLLLTCDVCRAQPRRLQIQSLATPSSSLP